TGLIDLSIEQIPDQDEQSAEYPVQVTASYGSAIGSLDTNGIRVNYRHIDSSTFNSVILTPSGSDNYTGVIPKMSAGSVVEYYASATTSLSETSIKQVPLQATPMRFLVGYKTKLTDNCESAANWNTSIANDNALHGLWEHGDPDGTFYQNAASRFIQQDTDHTVIGTQCFVTGNATTNSPSYDDIDSGTTTLVSPLYDISLMQDPYLRFWYFYSNNTGQNPGQTKFVVKLTTNEGGNFQTILSSSVSTDGWTSFGVRLKDDIVITDKFRIHFIASDNIGALVEAAVDDIEILDIPASKSVYQSNDIPVITLFPNPVTGSKVTLHLHGLKLRSLILRDILGKTILHKEYQRTESSVVEFSISETLPNGAYMLEYTTGDGTVKREKLVIAR
ncbi:MAG TPA: T9SS type A sorting domain-containing protein, partial [Candidatus Kapabacteria bacterium]